MANVTFEIKKTIAVLGHGTKGWQREFNLISWNGADPKYDIRDWDPDHIKMGKGITLTQEELDIICKAIGCEPKEEPAPLPEQVFTDPGELIEEPETPVQEVKEEQEEPDGEGYSVAQLAAIERARAMMAAS